MNFLLIDSSTKTFSLAVYKKGRIAAFKNAKLTKVLSDSIVPQIDGILKKSKVSLAGLDAIGVGLGPGSFTSLRVGLSTVKGLVFAAGKPVIGVSSLDVIAMGASRLADDICVVCDARRNLVYAAFYSVKAGELTRGSEYLLTTIDDVLSRVKAGMLVVGDGADVFKENILKAKQKAVIAPRKLWAPQARFLFPFVASRFSQKKFDNAGALVPIYLYREDCQVVSKGKG